MIKWLKNLFKRRKYTVDSIIKEANGSLKMLQFIVKDAVRYRPNKDHFKNPAKTLKDGHGNCDEFAYLYSELLRRTGYKPKIYACLFKDESKNHAICVFKEGDCYSYTSNSDYFKTNMKGDKDEFLKFAYPAERYEVVV